MKVVQLTVLMIWLMAPVGAWAQSTDAFCLAEQVEQLLAESKTQGWLGFYYRLVESNPGELEVIYVYAKGPAETAGLRVGDRVVGIGDERFDSGDPRVSDRQFQRTARSLRPGERVVFHLKRDDQSLELEVQAVPLQGHSLSEFIGRRVLVEYGRHKRGMRHRH